jgi:hypothetical protein
LIAGTHTYTTPYDELPGQMSIDIKNSKTLNPTRLQNVLNELNKKPQGSEATRDWNRSAQTGTTYSISGSELLITEHRSDQTYYHSKVMLGGSERSNFLLKSNDRLSGEKLPIFSKFRTKESTPGCN